MLIEVHGNVAGDRRAFETALATKCLELGLPLTVIDGNRGQAVSVPALIVAFPPTGSAWTAADAGTHADLPAVPCPVLPVIGSAPDAALLPAALRRYNAFQSNPWGGMWTDGLVDEVLSHGWQRRHDRRVFISYKRTESGPVANQLYESLTRLGYVTFLDDVSIDKGVDFQHELKWWLNDADVVVMLFTPNFENSKWCMEEVQFARASSIGLLAVEWPASTSTSVAPAASRVVDGVDLDQRLQLTDADFIGGSPLPLGQVQLTDDGLLGVIAHCARQRATAIRQRLDDLVPLATEVLANKNPMSAVGTTAGDYTFSKGVDRYFVRILPFRPDASCLHDAFQAASSSAPAGYDYIGCMYSEFDALDKRARAMGWLAQSERSLGTSSAQLRVWACVGDKVLP